MPTFVTEFYISQSLVYILLIKINSPGRKTLTRSKYTTLVELLTVPVSSFLYHRDRKTLLEAKHIRYFRRTSNSSVNSHPLPWRFPFLGLIPTNITSLSRFHCPSSCSLRSWPQTIHPSAVSPTCNVFPGTGYLTISLSRGEQKRGGTARTHTPSGPHLQETDHYSSDPRPPIYPALSSLRTVTAAFGSTCHRRPSQMRDRGRHAETAPS